MVNHTPQDIKRILSGHSSDVAKRLLGSLLVREINGHTLICRIVEVEAYNQTDAASHSYNGKTPRTEVMFGEAGHVYVYFTYGMHYCCNIVTGAVNEGEAVLLRALEPLEGIDMMALNRGREQNLTNGPARLAQALAINKTMNGHDITKEPFLLILEAPLPDDQIIATTRIGITKAKDSLLRFYIKNNSFVSR